MANGRWQIGLHIQEDSIRAVAVSRKRSGWALCRWWHLPAPENRWREGMMVGDEALVQALRKWRAQLPRGHRLRMAFPAQRTLQRMIPRPGGTLCESECEAWVARATARELHLPAQSLWLDYTLAEDSARFCVTAAQSQEARTLLENARAPGLNPEAITPDACALNAFWPYLPAGVQLIACEEAGLWLWASRSRWGTADGQGLMAVAEQQQRKAHEIAICGSPPAQAQGCLRLDPFSFLSYQQPPVVKEAARYAVALGLALGEVAR